MTRIPGLFPVKGISGLFPVTELHNFLPLTGILGIVPLIRILVIRPVTEIFSLTRKIQRKCLLPQETVSCESTYLDEPKMNFQEINVRQKFMTRIVFL